MRLPRTLFSGFSQIKNSRLVNKKNTDEEALSYVQKFLNAAQPVNEKETLMHDMVKTMYYADKRGFVRFLKSNSNIACMILWTEARAIVDFFGLRRVAYIRWMGRETLYTITQFQPSVEDGTVDAEAQYEHPIVKERRLQLEAKANELLASSHEKNVAGEKQAPEKMLVDSSGACTLPASLTPTVLKKEKVVAVSCWGDAESDGQEAKV
jgi:hypothetical protein